MSEATGNPAAAVNPVSAGNPAEPGIEQDDTDATLIVVVGLVSTALVLVSALGVSALYKSVVGGLTRERVEGAVYSQAENAIDSQERRLNEAPKLLDESAGTYSIPIDLAMKLVVKDLKAEQQTE